MNILATEYTERTEKNELMILPDIRIASMLKKFQSNCSVYSVPSVANKQ